MDKNNNTIIKYVDILEPENIFFEDINEWDKFCDNMEILS